MSSLTSLGRLSTDDWRRLGELADRLEQQWTQSDNVDLGLLLPQEPDPLRPTMLVELIKTELEIRYPLGKQPPYDFTPGVTEIRLRHEEAQPRASAAV